MPRTKKTSTATNSNKRRRKNGVMGPAKRTGGFRPQSKKTGPEKKFIDIPFCGNTAYDPGSTTPPTANMTPGYIPLNAANPTQIVLLNATSQGAAANQRIGNKIKLRKLKLNMIFQCNMFGFPSGATDRDIAAIPDTLIRWAVVLDKQSNGTQPNISDVYQLNDAITGTQYDQRPAGLAPMNLANRERFITLKTGLSAIGQLWSTSATVDEYIDLRGWETIFGANTNPPVVGGNGIATITTGALYLIMMIYSHNSNNVTGAIDVNVSAFTRVRFEDV